MISKSELRSGDTLFLYADIISCYISICLLRDTHSVSIISRLCKKKGEKKKDKKGRLKKASFCFIFLFKGHQKKRAAEGRKKKRPSKKKGRK